MQFRRLSLPFTVRRAALDCFVATLLAMTALSFPLTAWIAPGKSDALT
ncbi:hypothetical protein OGR47_11715 [Methylocystis sp. MJC1]|nr:hypothetical protein [Methylocystis sp. MJC1]MBU6527647.1 hypothetical protein [Methylocystis sp. MJC1]UZX10585.1 hypothetical protein OGR47_11715 [Methylocystis sp. MJC1]